MKNCYFCTGNIKYVNYRDTELLKKFLNPHARLVGHRRSGNCAKHQRQLSLAAKRARFLALLPFVAR
jgi:small subunit ribosomal protein S18